jgi:hypothetical protein
MYTGGQTDLFCILHPNEGKYVVNANSGNKFGVTKAPQAGFFGIGGGDCVNC